MSSPPGCNAAAFRHTRGSTAPPHMPVRRSRRTASTPPSRRCAILSQCMEAHGQPGAPPPARRAQRHRRPPPTLDRPRRAGPPATGGGRENGALHRRRVASVGLHHGDGLVKPCSYRVSVTLRPLGLAEIPILASRHSNFEGPRTTFKIQRGGCWIATVIDSSTTEGGYMAKPWAALPMSGQVILGSRVLRF